MVADPQPFYIAATVLAVWQFLAIGHSLSKIAANTSALTRELALVREELAALQTRLSQTSRH